MGRTACCTPGKLHAHFDMQEVGTLPRSNKQKSIEYYNKMGYSTMGVYIWGKPLNSDTADVNVMYILISRVMEKGCLYALSTLWHVLADIDVRCFNELSVWSDGAKQFKNSRWIGTILYDVLKKYDLKQASVNFGCPMHFKSKVDSEFGEVSTIIDRAVLKEDLVLNEVVEVVNLLQGSFDKRKVLRQAVEVQGCEHKVVEFLPTKKSSVASTYFSKKSLPSLQNIFSVCCARVDMRRQNLVGLDRCTLKGLKIKARALTGSNVPPDFQGHPEIGVEAAKAAEEGAEDEVVDELPPGTQATIWREWRCSYSRSAPPNKKRLLA